MVSAVGLQLQGMSAGGSGGIYKLKSPLQALVVVAAHLGNHQWQCGDQWPARRCGTLQTSQGWLAIRAKHRTPGRGVGPLGSPRVQTPCSWKGSQRGPRHKPLLMAPAAGQLREPKLQNGAARPRPREPIRENRSQRATHLPSPAQSGSALKAGLAILQDAHQSEGESSRPANQRRCCSREWARC